MQKRTFVEEAESNQRNHQRDGYYESSFPNSTPLTAEYKKLAKL